MASAAEVQIKLLYENIARGLPIYLERDWILSKNLAVSIAGNEDFCVELAMLLDDGKGECLGEINPDVGQDETSLTVLTFHDCLPSFHPWKEGEDGSCIFDGVMNAPWPDYGYSINKRQR